MRLEGLILVAMFMEEFSDAEIGQVIRAAALYDAEGIGTDFKDRALVTLYQDLTKKITEQKQRIEEYKYIQRCAVGKYAN